MKGLQGLSSIVRSAALWFTFQHLSYYTTYLKLTISENKFLADWFGNMLELVKSLYLSPVFTFGTDAQKEQYVRPLLTGTKIGCFSLSEPGTHTHVREFFCFASDLHVSPSHRCLFPLRPGCRQRERRGGAGDDREARRREVRAERHEGVGHERRRGWGCRDLRERRPRRQTQGVLHRPNIPPLPPRPGPGGLREGHLSPAESLRPRPTCVLYTRVLFCRL